MSDGGIDVQRVQRLIALAVDPAASEAEARTSALIACKTIRTRGLVIYPPNGAPGQAESYANGYRDGKAAARPAPAPRSPPPKSSRVRRVIRARFDGSCRNCGESWAEGERIAWAPGLGATCLDCREAGL